MPSGHEYWNIAIRGTLSENRSKVTITGTSCWDSACVCVHVLSEGLIQRRERLVVLHLWFEFTVTDVVQTVTDVVQTHIRFPYHCGVERTALDMIKSHITYPYHRGVERIVLAHTHVTVV